MEQVSDSFVLTTTYGPRLTGCGAGSNNMKVGHKPSDLDVQPYREELHFRNWTDPTR
jgi:hypothetical protein